MYSLTNRRIVFAFILFSVFSSCKKDISDINSKTGEEFPTSSTQATSFGTCDYNLDESVLLNAKWTKRFEDNFTTNSLSQWNIWTGGAYNYELQHYQSSNLVINNGILSIEAKRQTVTGATLPSDPTLKTFDFTSGRIESKTNFSSSPTTPKVRIIARIKLPTGYGMWPAFWSYGDPWPTHGEIDIMEARGNEPYTYSTAYWYGRRSGVNSASGTEGSVSSSVSLTDCFHVFEVIWQKSSLTYLFDGQIVGTKTGGWISDFYRKTERVTLNLAVGGLFFGNPPPSPNLIVTGTMQVDWVKVFTSN